MTPTHAPAPDTQPEGRALFYVLAAGLSAQDLEVAACLCQGLNLAGGEAYLQADTPMGRWWAPLWLPAQASMHYRAQRRPLVVVLPGVHPPEGARLGVVQYLQWADAPVAASPPVVYKTADWPELSIPHSLTGVDTLAPVAQALLKLWAQHCRSVELARLWPQSALDALPGVYLKAPERAARADRVKWARVHEQYAQWRERSSLREIDGQIAAELMSRGEVAPVAVVIDHRAGRDADLADTLEALGANLAQPVWVHVLSAQPQPADWVDAAGLSWGDQTQAVQVLNQRADWVLVLEAGVTLRPQALVEWGWHAQASAPHVLGLFADEDMVAAGQAASSYPFFKPDANIELLQSMNYIGLASLWRKAVWQAAAAPCAGPEAYGLALRTLQQNGRSALGHIDLVLFGAPAYNTAQRENAEFLQAQQALAQTAPDARLQPLPQWGTWAAHYPAPQQACVSLVIPTGLQTGYLASLLKGVARETPPQLVEIVLVCQTGQRPEVEVSLVGLDLPPVRWALYDAGSYVHGQALNLGVRQASSACVLVCDDDIDPLHRDWLGQLLALLQRPDVGCVAPRLMSAQGDDALVVGGPVVLGVQGGAAPYLGEERGIHEQGVYGRLQLTQDVSAVQGHCFMFRKADWAQVGGFDEGELAWLHPVLDFCLKLGELGRRHVWTPLSGVMHHGGKSLEVVRRQPRAALEWTDRALAERDVLQRRWGARLAKDPAYNRHLSLQVPFDIERDIVIDWQPKRKDRPRALAVPLHSGAGQYRVVEPFAALQAAGLAQTAVILPLKGRAHRLLQPLELLRAAPDVLVLQHSVDDGQLALIDQLRAVAPHIPIVQMVDDLFGEVPEKHPNRSFQSREGHSRMMQALRQSQRMIVTTEPLREHYAKYVSDVRLVPNCLAAQWDGLAAPAKPHAKLRVGWVGAAQHRGDLEMIADVVAELADEVDWVFMGMCPDALKPHVREFHPFVSIAEYPRKMASLDLDIAIAPLEDNLFNRCKSNLRLLEYGAMGWPVVCSDVYPYQTENPPVLRVSASSQAWIQGIRSLSSIEKRKHFGSQLLAWVDQSFRIDKKVEDWNKALFEGY